MAMKLVVAIVHNEDADNLIDALSAAHYGATRLASTGGFLRQGNTTVIVGVPDEAVQNVLDIVSEHSHGRRQHVTNPFPDSTAISSTKTASGSGDHGSNNPLPVGSVEATIQTGRATVFVLNLERYEHV
jgi:uncharacterized protein YaaQ